jgi:hypothetical protein
VTVTDPRALAPEALAVIARAAEVAQRKRSELQGTGMSYVSLAPWSYVDGLLNHAAYLAERLASLTAENQRLTARVNELSGRSNSDAVQGPAPTAVREDRSGGEA